MSRAKLEDLEDQVFNSLTAIRVDRWQAGKGYYWWFRCECGKEEAIRLTYVRSGHIKSCGCRRKSTKRNFPGPCIRCGEITDRKTARGGYSKICQKCFNKQCNHTDDPIDYLWSRAKGRANKHGLPFTITRQDIQIPAYCPILGIELKHGGSLSERGSSPSLDKIIPQLGYVLGNIAVISHRANNIKNNATADEHRRIADWMDSQVSQIEKEAA